MYIYTYVHMYIPTAESGLSKQLLGNFQVENSCDHKQLVHVKKDFLER